MNHTEEIEREVVETLYRLWIKGQINSNELSLLCWASGVRPELVRGKMLEAA